MIALSSGVEIYSHVGNTQFLLCVSGLRAFDDIGLRTASVTTVCISGSI